MDDAVTQAGFDTRWHQETHEKVQSHDRMLRGHDDDPGLGERVRNIERYVNRSVEEVEAEKHAAMALVEADKHDRKANRFQIMLAVWAACLALLGLLAVTVMDHTLWKPSYYAPQTQSTSTTVTNGENSVTTTKGELKK